MNIKMKAAMTVVVGVASMVGLALGIRSIPQELIDEYGSIVLQVGLVATALYIFYLIALDYYKASEELKEIERRMEERKKRDEKLYTADGDNILPPNMFWQTTYEETPTQAPKQRVERRGGKTNTPPKKK